MENKMGLRYNFECGRNPEGSKDNQQKRHNERRSERGIPALKVRLAG